MKNTQLISALADQGISREMLGSIVGNGKVSASVIEFLKNPGKYDLAERDFHQFGEDLMKNNDWITNVFMFSGVKGLTKIVQKKEYTLKVFMPEGYFGTAALKKFLLVENAILAGKDIHVLLKQRKISLPSDKKILTVGEKHVYWEDDDGVLQKKLFVPGYVEKEDGGLDIDFGCFSEKWGPDYYLVILCEVEK